MLFAMMAMDSTSETCKPSPQNFLFLNINYRGHGVLSQQESSRPSFTKLTRKQQLLKKPHHMSKSQLRLCACRERNKSLLVRGRWKGRHTHSRQAGRFLQVTRGSWPLQCSTVRHKAKPDENDAEGDRVCQPATQQISKNTIPKVPKWPLPK